MYGGVLLFGLDTGQEVLSSTRKFEEQFGGVY